MTVLLALVVACACDSRTRSDDLQLTIGTAAGGVYYPLAKDLARIYTNATPGLRVSVVATSGPSNNIHAISQGLIDLTFAQSDVLYAFSQARKADEVAERRESGIRSIAVLHASPIHVATLSGNGIRRLSDLRGRRVNMSISVAGTQDAMRTLLYAHAVDADDATFSQLAWSEAVHKLKARELDALMFSAIAPNPGFAALAREAHIRLIPADIDAINSIRRRYGFFRPVTLPAGVYHGVDESVLTIGVDNVFVCRAALPEEVVYELTKALFSSIPALSDAHAVAQSMRWANSPATPIPLHPGAVRYYRERELLQSY